jgi:hypothetical protein
MGGDHLAFYEGLTALAADTFPKRCGNCGRLYHSVEDFLRQTEAVRGNHSGLKASEDGGDRTVVELFRNCVCGSTLMDVFNDRRDQSEQGLRRRLRFEQLLDLLEARGIARDTARHELLRLLSGERSQLLEPLLPPSRPEL